MYIYVSVYVCMPYVRYSQLYICYLRCWWRRRWSVAAQLKWKVAEWRRILAQSADKNQQWENTRKADTQIQDTQKQDTKYKLKDTKYEDTMIQSYKFVALTGECQMLRNC